MRDERPGGLQQAVDQLVEQLDGQEGRRQTGSGAGARHLDEHRR
jgi:hypothetical protein